MHNNAGLISESYEDTTTGKLQNSSPTNTRQSLVMIGQVISEIRRRKKRIDVRRYTATHVHSRNNCSSKT